ncbi:hypothetical protein ACS0TY_008773 [Phlomoides rotata]
MDFHFQVDGVKSFFLEAGWFDTVRDIKEKIEKHRGIPISKQTFIFNQQILDDDLLIHNSDVADQSQIQLIIDKHSIEPADDSNDTINPADEPPKIPLVLKLPSSKLISFEIDANDTIRELKEEIHEIEGIPTSRLILHANGIELNNQKSIKHYDLPNNSELTVTVGAIAVTPPPAARSANKLTKVTEKLPPPQKIKLLVTMPLPKVITLEINANDTIRRLKERLYEMEGVHPSRLILCANGIELNDFKSIKDCRLSDNSKVSASIRAIPVVPLTAAPHEESSSSAEEPEKLRVVINIYSGGQFPVEVNSLITLGELRDKLKNMEVNLPEHFFFIHDDAVIYDDDRSLKWHRVTDGDTIDIFVGYVA